MLEKAHALPDDIAALKAMVLSSRAELAARDAELRNRDLLIEKLKHQLAGLRRQRFGASSGSRTKRSHGRARCCRSRPLQRSGSPGAAPYRTTCRASKRIQKN